MSEHFRKLERMYQTAPINALYRPVMTVSEGEAEIVIDVHRDLFHAAGAVHGSVYFKMLDDAAYFASNSLEMKTFVLTASFTTYLTRPISEGQMRAHGTVVHRSKTQFIAESVVTDHRSKEIARGNGIFVRGKTPLIPEIGYA